jgi:hypothetical protein
VIEGTRLGTRTVKGTFNYMAPEAFDPIGAGGLTVRPRPRPRAKFACASVCSVWAGALRSTLRWVQVKADCWSWACCVIELFTGRPPWENDRMAVIMQKVLVARQKPTVPTVIPVRRPAGECPGRLPKGSRARRDPVPRQEPVASMLGRCFATSPGGRPSFPEMLPVLQQTLSSLAGGVRATHYFFFFTLAEALG